MRNLTVVLSGELVDLLSHVGVPGEQFLKGHGATTGFRGILALAGEERRIERNCLVRRETLDLVLPARPARGTIEVRDAPDHQQSRRTAPCRRLCEPVRRREVRQVVRPAADDPQPSMIDQQAPQLSASTPSVEPAVT